MTFLSSHTLSAMLASDQSHARFLASLGGGGPRRRKTAPPVRSKRRTARSR
jgi:hypothetical protein